MLLRHPAPTEGESGPPYGIGPVEDDDTALRERAGETARFMPR